MQKVFAVIHKDPVVRAASRSGGVFTALSDVTLKQNGIVFGCVMKNSFSAVHMPAVDSDQRNMFRNSKYIESDLSQHDCFQNVKKDLQADKYVLFSGTSCQVEGLIGYLENVDYSKLLTVDILCHGIPSARIWREYLSWFSERKHGQVEKINFRNKEVFGWADHTETLTVKGKQYHNKYFRDLYSTNSISRPACYKCPYKNVNHGADITIGDYWGLGRIYPDFGADNKGVSLVIINSQKGYDKFEKICSDIDYRESDIEHCLQGALIAPYKRPLNRDVFWNDYYVKGFPYVIKKYTKKPFISFVKKLIPSKLRKKIRKK